MVKNVLILVWFNLRVPTNFGENMGILPIWTMSVCLWKNPTSSTKKSSQQPITNPGWLFVIQSQSAKQSACRDIKGYIYIISAYLYTKHPQMVNTVIYHLWLGVFCIRVPLIFQWKPES